MDGFLNVMDTLGRIAVVVASVVAVHLVGYQYVVVALLAIILVKK